VPTLVNCHSPRGAIFNTPRSLKHEYELYVEREIEDYKDSVSRSSLLKIGDEAVSILLAQDQIALTEILVWLEVDRIITKRLRLPKYGAWSKRRLLALEQYRRPEHWGIDPDAAFVRALQDSSDRHVLVAGARREGPALYLAAHGCAVTSVESTQDDVERVQHAAEMAGLTERVRSYCAELGSWAPDVELHAVVCSPTAFAGLSPADRDRVIEVLKSATADGGVHLVETLAAATGAEELALEELESRYSGWKVSIERNVGPGGTFLARKAAAVA
jgi:hypothetical protein